MRLVRPMVRLTGAACDRPTHMKGFGETEKWLASSQMYLRDWKSMPQHIERVVKAKKWLVSSRTYVHDWTMPT